MVEQIINVDVDKRFDENWYPNCFVVDDENNEVNGYNLRYHPFKKRFEVVPGIEPMPEVVFIPSETEILMDKIASMYAIEESNLERINNLEIENKSLRDEITMIKSRLGI